MKIHAHPRRVWRMPARALALGSALALAVGGMGRALPAFADVDDGAEHSHDFNADHDGIFQVQRGDRICYTREACGGAEAIPMNTPGLWTMPGGMMPHKPVSAK
ncbi:MAG: hypothetical protein JO216_21085 [Hyphomicrobiales bacterium]|nr:hypothetical protein [Hyphomicrobiales bacterium]MBW0005971.1 hypothetical protein [Hyphomicrobiales bacterium]